MKYKNSLPLSLIVILLISWAENAVATRPNPLDLDTPNAGHPISPQSDTSAEAGDKTTTSTEVDDTTAIKLYTQWLQSTSGARSAPSDDTQSFSEGFINFKETLARVNKINTDPDIQWTAGLNSGANLPANKQYPLMSINIEPEPAPDEATASSRAAYGYKGPTEVDWVSAGKVTPVKTQGSCGSCWAFSAISTIESQLLISGGPETDLSEQFLVNCDGNSAGCIGGYIKTALTFVESKGGAPLEIDLPYQENKTECTSQPSRVKISGVGATMTYSASAIMAAVAQQPVAFLFDVATDFTLYKSGVYSSTSCFRTGAGSSSAHAMTIVGFNITNDPPYWIVRNSWGSGDAWGMNGYGWIKMDPDNTPGQCSMYMYPMHYPITAALVVDSNNNGIDDSLEEILSPIPEIKCTGYGYSNYYIGGYGKVIKNLTVKNFDACAVATVDNNGGIFNFSKKTKKCTVMKGTWDGISGYLIPDKTMMAGFPSCVPVE